GGEDFEVRGVLDIVNDNVRVFISSWECVNVTRVVDNGKDATDPEASFTLYCVTPAGVGEGLPIVILSETGSQSSSGLSFTFSYGRPVVADMNLWVEAANAGARLLAIADGVPTLGANITLTGANFGTPALSPVVISWLNNGVLNATYQDHERIVFMLPPGDGVSHVLQVTVGSQISAPILFRFRAPFISSITPTHAPTAGGAVLTVYGNNFGVSLPAVMVGGLPCIVAQPFVPALQHDAVSCVLPAGEGMSLPVSLVVGTQASTAAVTATFTYDAPSVSGVSVLTASTSGRTLGAMIDELHYSDGEPIVQTVFGTNFGRSGSVRLMGDDLSDVPELVVSVPSANVLTWNHTTIQFRIPEGYGKTLVMVVTTGGQSSPIAA
ncbi:hypothetical protein EON62_05840, partial [archaeon]